MHGPSLPWFVKELLLLHYLQFILWCHLLWFLLLSLSEAFFHWKIVNISLQHANTTNSCNWTASYTLIFPDTIILFRTLTCSIVVWLYYCRDPTCGSIGDNLWILTWYIWWYISSITRRINWRDYILSSRFWLNLSSSSTVSVVPFALAVFSALSCSSLSFCIFKQVELFMVYNLGLFCPCVI